MSDVELWIIVVWFSFVINSFSLSCINKKMYDVVKTTSVMVVFHFLKYCASRIRPADALGSPDLTSIWARFSSASTFPWAHALVTVVYLQLHPSARPPGGTLDSLEQASLSWAATSLQHALHRLAGQAIGGAKSSAGRGVWRGKRWAAVAGITRRRSSY